MQKWVLFGSHIAQAIQMLVVLRIRHAGPRLALEAQVAAKSWRVVAAEVPLLFIGGMRHEGDVRGVVVHLGRGWVGGGGG